MVLQTVPAVLPRQTSILVVDDDPALRELFAQVLQRAGHATLEAEDGLTALRLLEAHDIELVLLDSRMPRLDGPGVLRELRARPATRTLPVILVTGQLDLEDRVRGLESGADDYLTKPVAIAELVARVDAQLRSHAAWLDSMEEARQERRRLTALLREIPLDSTPEAAARTVVAALAAALGLDPVAILAFASAGSAVPLAVVGAAPFRAGVALAPAEAGRLGLWAAEGPWSEPFQVASPPRSAAPGTLAYLPLPGSDGPFGLLVLGLPPSRDVEGSDLMRRLGFFAELGEMVAAVLRPAFEAAIAQRSARSAVAAVIDEANFTPHFQPIVSLRDRSILGYEALTRFGDGVSPEIRFAEAARLGLGHELELATLEAAVAAAAQLPASALLSVNLSPSLVLARTELGRLLAAAGRRVVIELTEHAPVRDYADLQRSLAQIDPPVLIAIDDAGSGYASLRHVLEIAPAYIKLDASWVRSIERDPARRALVAGMVSFASEIGSQLIAEGIETEAQHRILVGLGVPLGQGYLFARPSP